MSEHRRSARVFGGMSAAPRILIVDDNVEDRLSIFRCTLRALPDATLHAASSGAEAIAFLASHPTDILLLDNQLTDMTGADLLRHVREMAPNVHIIGMGYGYHTRAEMLAAGANSFVDKMDEAEITAVLRGTPQTEFANGA